MIQSVRTDDCKLLQESNLTAGKYADPPSLSTSYLTLLPPSEWGLVNPLNGDGELAPDTGR